MVLEKISQSLQKSSAVRCVLEAVFLKGIAALLGVLLGILLARSLGAEDVGVFYLALAVVSIGCNIGRYGVDTALLRLVSASADEGDWGRVKALYWSGLWIVVCVSLIVMIVMIAASSFFATVIFKESELSGPIQIMALSIPIFVLINVHAELLKARRYISKAIITQSVLFPLLAGLLVIILSRFLGINGVAIAYVLAYLFVLGVGVYFWRSVMVRHVPQSLSTYRTQSKILLKTGFTLLLISLLNVVVDTSDTLMIGMFLDSSDVGLYGVALRLSTVSSMLLVVVNSVFASDISSLWESGEHKKLQSLVRTVTVAMLVAALALIAGFIIFSDVLLGLFGREFVAAEYTLVLLAVGQFFVLGTGPVAYLLMMTGHEKFHRNNMILCAVLNILLNGFLIPFCGINGAAIATAMSLAIKNVLGVIYVRKKLKIKVLV